MSPQGVPLTWHFSLPTQRCFPPWQDLPRGFLLFSAYAEVFPVLVVVLVVVLAFLCLRRGVSAPPAHTG